MGPDEMHLRVRRELADAVFGLLSIIFEKSWWTGEVPDEWKNDNITPIFKKGKNDELRNYQPITLISVLGKVIEQIHQQTLLRHMEHREVIKENNHGFTKGKSCLTSLVPS